MNCLAPGALYGDPTYDGDRSPGGTLNYEARRFLMREDILPAPLFALSFNNGSSVTMLDPSPNGESTVDETKLPKDVMTDARFQFGALGAWQADEEPNRVWFSVPRYGEHVRVRPKRTGATAMDSALSSDRSGSRSQLRT